jgi:transcriptional regulator with XRE-family HTH domain
MDALLDYVPDRRACLSHALKTLRRRRGLRTSEVAEALGMALRSYQHLEAGKGRVSVELVLRVAKVLKVDSYAILAAVEINSPDFAVRCLDNKLVTVFLMGLKDFDARFQDSIAQLDPATLMSAFRSALDELGRIAQERSAVAGGGLGDDSRDE